MWYVGVLSCSSLIKLCGIWFYIQGRKPKVMRWHSVLARWFFEQYALYSYLSCYKAYNLELHVQGCMPHFKHFFPNTDNDIHFYSSYLCFSAVFLWILHSNTDKWYHLLISDLCFSVFFTEIPHLNTDKWYRLLNSDLCSPAIAAGIKASTFLQRMTSRMKLQKAAPVADFVRKWYKSQPSLTDEVDSNWLG